MPTKLQTDRIAWLRVLAMLAAGVVTAITTNVISGADGDGIARTDCKVDFCAADDDELVVTAPGTFEAAAEGVVSLGVPTGGSVNLDTTGVAVSSSSTGDDIALSAAHDITLGTTSGNITMLSGANATLTCSTTGFACNATEAVINASSGDDVHIYTNVGGGDDINLDAGDDLAVTAGDDITISPTDTFTLTSASFSIGDATSSFSGTTLRTKYLTLAISSGYRAAPNTTNFRFTSGISGKLVGATMMCQTAPASALGTMTGAFYDGFTNTLISSGPTSIEGAQVSWTPSGGGAFVGTSGAGVEFRVVTDNADATYGAGCMVFVTMTVP